MKKINQYSQAKKVAAPTAPNLIPTAKAAFAQVQESMLNPSKSLQDLPLLVDLAKLFNMSETRTALFISIFCLGDIDAKPSEKTISQMFKRYFNNETRELRSELREMKRLGFIDRVKDEGTMVWELTSKYSEAMDQNNLEVISSIGPVGLEAVLEFFKQKLMDYDKLSTSEIDQHLADLSRNNEKLNIIQYCDKDWLFLPTVDAYLLLAICTHAVIEGESFDFGVLDRHVSIGIRNMHYFRQQITAQEWGPMIDGYVELDGGDHVEYNPKIKLTSKGFDYFLHELDAAFIKTIKNKVGAIKTPMVQPAKIEKVSLFFNPEFQSKADRLSKLLHQESFAKYQDSFPKSAKMKGLTLLFHGAPGCGKTEFALQLAKRTERPLMKVEVTDFQSKWVGESERQLKQIFNDYRTACDRSDRFPILFFNECDQIIGTRIGIKNSVDQMSNALQNILLEEMESFQGIMIGTTNLTANMDPAFERRWVMKLPFESPNNLAKQSIWKSAIKGLKTNEAQILVSEFDLTPGEIQNVARRFSIEKMLGLTQPRMATLRELCATERYAQSIVTKSIGFSFQQQELQSKAS